MFLCGNRNPANSSFMTYHRVCKWSNITGATSGAGTAFPSGVPEFAHGFSRVHVAQSIYGF